MALRKNSTVGTAPVPASGNGSTVAQTSATPIKIARIGAYEIFDKCIRRAENLLKIHSTAHGKKGKPEEYLADIHRAAIVLAISALDAFIRSFVVLRVISIVADKQRAIPPMLGERIKSLLKPDSLLEAARKDDLLERVEKALRKSFERESFQGTRLIAESLRLVGYDNIFHDVAIEAEENEETLCQRLDEFTNRRHVIAHNGDYDLTQNPPTEKPITKREAKECINVVKLVASNINKLGLKS
jgi:hypothetical protein